jgi:hypothetical protein
MQQQRERRSRTDLKELARLAVEMPRTTPTPSSGGPPAWTRYAMPRIVLPVPAPIITTKPEPVVAPEPQPPRRASALTGAIVGACVGLVLSAMGIAALVLAK